MDSHSNATQRIHVCTPSSIRSSLPTAERRQLHQERCEPRSPIPPHSTQPAAPGSTQSRAKNNSNAVLIDLFISLYIIYSL